MQINETKSYTEYTTTAPTTDFVVGFEYFNNKSIDTVNITVDGIDTASAGYVVSKVSDSVFRLTPEVPSGTTVRLVRETDLDAPIYKFSEGALFRAPNVDANFKQILHAQQEVRDAFDFLAYSTLGVVEAAKDATDRANNVADEVEGLLDKELTHNDLRGRDVGGAHPASAISDVSGKDQQEINDEQRQINETYQLANNTKADKVDVLPATQTTASFKNAYSSSVTNQWARIRAKTPCGRAYIWKNPKHVADTAYRFSLGINQSGWKTAEWDFIADVDNFYRMRYGYVGAIREPSLKLDTTETSITPLGTNGNKYFSASTQLNETFKVNFTGVGFLMNHRCDEYGGMWEISVDGVVIKVISTHINNPENATVQSSNITKLITNTLPSGTHEATFKFIGDDPLYPPTGGVSRGWFKIIEGTGTFPTAFIVTGDEMGMSANGTTLVSNNILEFAIGGTPTATSYPADWIPAHGSASGCIAIQKRTIFINNNAYDDNLSGISSEVEIKEFTMIQDYTAYNSSDNSKTYPLWSGELITKFNQADGLHYIHNFKTISEFLSSDGYTAMGSAQRRDSSGNVLLKKLTCDNGFSLDISGAPPASQLTYYAGNLTSVAWEGDHIALAMKVGSAEASGAIGRNTTDGRTTVVTERPDRFCKLYFKPIGTNKIIPSGTEFSDIHYIWLANLN